MFKKDFKIKSNLQLKTTERKILKETFSKNFPMLTDNDLNGILPKKEAVFSMKIVTADNTITHVYLVQKRAIAFEVDNVLYPSIYLLWKFTNVTIKFTTSPYVITKLQGGADLMLPGVIMNPNGFEVFGENEKASINTTANIAAVAVGITAIASHDIVIDRPKGKCVIVYHVHGDKLCSLEDMPVLPVPNLGVPHWLDYALGSTNDFPPLGGDTNKKSDISPVDMEPKTPTDSEPENAVLEAEVEEIPEVNITEEMDKLLVNSFLTAIKYSKTLKLPVLTSTFYKQEVMPLFPPDKNFEIKKTSFKKVGQFLKHMVKEHVIVVSEKKKGVEMLEEINYVHPMVTDFFVNVEDRPKKPAEQAEGSASAPNITESYAVTSAVYPLFQEFGFKKGDTLSLPDVRKYVTSYVANHELRHKLNASLVDASDAKLAKLCKSEQPITWEKLMSNVCEAMTTCFKVTSGFDETVAKGKIQPITMTVQIRSGNKKVTLIDNLEIYGIRLSEFSKDCQHGIGASATVVKLPGKKSDQLLVQGNQILYVYQLLSEKYKIPNKYIRGLENAPKSKKK